MLPKERKAMVETTASCVSNQVPLIIQVGACPTSTAMELARHAIRAGADAIATVAPTDHPNNLQAAVKHYKAIGGATNAPFYVYWVAQTAEKNVGAEQFLEAMKSVPNFSGIKFTDFNFYLFQRLVSIAGDQLNIISGPDEMCLGAMVAGADAAIGSTYNIMPKIFLQMRNYFEESKIGPAMELQDQANSVISAMMQYGFLGSLKGILTARGYCVGPPRSPHNTISVHDLNNLLSKLDNLGLEVD